MSRLSLVAVLCVVLAAPAAAQHRHAWQVHGIAALADASFVGGGLGGGVRIGRRLELAATASAGVLEERFAGRVEVLALFHLRPFQRRGVGVYGGGGVGVTGTDGAVDERLVLLLGVQRAEAARAAWFVEAGVGGGIRIAAGVRVRGGRRAQ